MIDASKQYRTKSGFQVRIYATDCGGNTPIHGAIYYPMHKEWGAASWRADGQLSELGPTVCDLVEVVTASDDLDAAATVYEEA